MGSWDLGRHVLTLASGTVQRTHVSGRLIEAITGRPTRRRTPTTRPRTSGKRRVTTARRRTRRTTKRPRTRPYTSVRVAQLVRPRGRRARQAHDSLYRFGIAPHCADLVSGPLHCIALVATGVALRHLTSLTRPALMGYCHERSINVSGGYHAGRQKRPEPSSSFSG